MKKITPEKHSKLFWILSDSWILIRRGLTHIFRNTDQLLSIIIQPVMFTLLFRYVFGGAINTGGTTYVNYLMAGILVQTASFGSMTTSLGVATDLQRGIVDRFRSLPMFSAAVLMGHVSADMVRNTLSSVVMILVGLLIGFRPTATVEQWFIAFGLLLLFSFALSWLAAIAGLIAKSVEAVQWIGFVAIFPLTFASSAFVPTSGMPNGLRIFAENQPVTQVIESMRALLVGTPLGNHGWLSLAWSLGIIAIAIPTAAYLFRKRGEA